MRTLHRLGGLGQNPLSAAYNVFLAGRTPIWTMGQMQANLPATLPTPPVVTPAAPSTQAQMTGAADWTPDQALSSTWTNQLSSNLNFFSTVSPTVGTDPANIANLPPAGGGGNPATCLSTLGGGASAQFICNNWLMLAAGLVALLLLTRHR